MCGVLKLICVLACLLVVPANSQAQQDRRKGSHARCRKPCFQWILKKLDKLISEVKKSGQGIDEIKTKVGENGENIDVIIDLIEQGEKNIKINPKVG